MIFAILLIFLATATILGNIFCLIVIHKGIQGITNVLCIFMKSLTTADLLSGMFVTTQAIGPAFTGSWPFGNYMCYIGAFAQNLCMTCSVLSLMAVNAERYIAIEFPLHYTKLVTSSRARIAVLMIWIFGLGWASLHVFRPGQIAIYHPGILMCVADPVNSEDADITSIIAAMGFFALPCLITLCLFVRLYCISRRHARQIDAEGNVLRQVEGNAINRFRRTEFKTSVTFIILTVILVLTYAPAAVIMGLDGSNKFQLTRSMWQWSSFLMFSNYTVNVVLYFIRNKSFRSRAKQLLGFVNDADNSTSTYVITGRTK